MLKKPLHFLKPNARRLAAHRQQASRKLKMARLLENGGLLEEEREALLQSALLVSKALAVENRAPEPEQLEDAFRPRRRQSSGPPI